MPSRTIAKSREAWLGQRLATSSWITVELAEAGLPSKLLCRGPGLHIRDPDGGRKHDSSRLWTSASFLQCGRNCILPLPQAWSASLKLPLLPLLPLPALLLLATSLRCHPVPFSPGSPVSSSTKAWCSLSVIRWSMVMYEMPTSLTIWKKRLSKSGPNAEVHSSKIAKRGRWYSNLASPNACCSRIESTSPQSTVAWPSFPMKRADLLQSTSAKCSRPTYLSQQRSSTSLRPGRPRVLGYVS
mmetsp:Transcript_3507/g.6705  ORF Transcript_3507/g.6705 Transcript_3507/m.6705 type:complete len:242 (-) Transcript_3507:2015-2740(-)